MFKSADTNMPFDLKLMYQEAVIDEVIYPGRKWRVRYQGSWWDARSEQLNMTLDIGATVYVIGRQNLVLLIQSIPPYFKPPHNQSRQRRLL